VIVKLALMYSTACNAVKSIAKITVNTNPQIASILLPAVIA
jgi:hypothetical protein